MAASSDIDVDAISGICVSLTTIKQSSSHARHTYDRVLRYTLCFRWMWRILYDCMSSNEKEHTPTHTCAPILLKKHLCNEEEKAACTLTLQSAPQSTSLLHEMIVRNNTQQRVKIQQRREIRRNNNNTSTILREDWWISRLLYPVCNNIRARIENIYMYMKTHLSALLWCDFQEMFNRKFRGIVCLYGLHRNGTERAKENPTNERILHVFLFISSSH